MIWGRKIFSDAGEEVMVLEADMKIGHGLLRASLGVRDHAPVHHIAYDL